MATTEKRMDAMQGQMAQMQEQLNRHSGNSSKPPSSDIKQVEKKRQKAKGKKRGGQSGHPGYSRFLYAVEECESREDGYASACWHCGNSVTPTGEAPYRHQVVEISPILPEVRKYRLHECRCAACGSVTRSRYPAPPISFWEFWDQGWQGVLLLLSEHDRSFFSMALPSRSLLDSLAQSQEAC